jgi:hypothetical protein
MLPPLLYNAIESLFPRGGGAFSLWIGAAACTDLLFGCSKCGSRLTDHVKMSKGGMV